jgi:AGZA family xanthine/uracil permease-like MFS transporter
MGEFLQSRRAKFAAWMGLTSPGVTVMAEFRAALTTFLAMAYILFLNPKILAPAFSSMSVDNMAAQLLSATALAAAFGSILMGLVARLPIALAPGMGLNAYFTYSVVLSQGISCQTALGAVFVSGVFFIILSVSGLREAIVNAIPTPIKRASGAGIGMFLALIGLQAGGIVQANPTTMVGLGELNSPQAWLAIGGLAVTTALLLRRVPGAILLGIFSVSLIAVIFDLPVFDGKGFSGFDGGIIGWPVWPVNLIGALDIRGALDSGIWGVVLTFFFVAFFDTAGTLIGLSEVAKFTDGKGRMFRAGEAFTADAVATTVGAFIGTSTTTAYMESAAGIEDGGKTGLVAVFAGLLFLMALFFWPLASAVPPVATAPTLVVVGAMLLESIGRINWRDHHEAVPAFVTMLTMPLTFSIANGIALGIMTYVLVSLLSGRAKQIHPLLALLAVVLVARYFWFSGGNGA